MSKIEKKIYPVLGMHCAGCANNVERTVKGLDGVVNGAVKNRPSDGAERPVRVALGLFPR